MNTIQEDTKSLPQEIITFAELSMSDEITKEIDFNDMINETKKTLQKIEEIKKFKNEYDKKTLLKRIWSKSDLDEKSRDMTFLMADMSKLQTQMSIFNILLSKSIQEHQKIIEHQNEEIFTNSIKLEAHFHNFFEFQDNQEEVNQITLNLMDDISDFKTFYHEKIETLSQKTINEITQLNTQVKYILDNVNINVLTELKKNYYSLETTINSLDEKISSYSLSLNKIDKSDKKTTLSLIIASISFLISIFLILK